MSKENNRSYDELCSMNITYMLVMILLGITLQEQLP